MKKYFALATLLTLIGALISSCGYRERSAGIDVTETEVMADLSALAGNFTAMAQPTSDIQSFQNLVREEGSSLYYATGPSGMGTIAEIFHLNFSVIHDPSSPGAPLDLHVQQKFSAFFGISASGDRAALVLGGADNVDGGSGSTYNSVWTGANAGGNSRLGTGSFSDADYLIYVLAKDRVFKLSTSDLAPNGDLATVIRMDVALVNDDNSETPAGFFHLAQPLQ